MNAMGVQMVGRAAIVAVAVSTAAHPQVGFSFRILSDAEVRELAQLADELITRPLTPPLPAQNEDEEQRQALGWRFPERAKAVQRLVDLRHPWCIPAMLAVLRDHADQPRLRTLCARGLSEIPDKRVVGFLIDALTYDAQPVVEEAYAGIRRLCARDFEFDATAPKELRQRQAKVIRKWWQANRSRARLEW